MIRTNSHTFKTLRMLQAVRPANMSWQTYVDDHLLVPLPNGGQLSHAAIVGQDGGVWAQDAGFPAVSVEEVQALVKGCNDTSTGYALRHPITAVQHILNSCWSYSATVSAPASSCL